MTIDPNYGLILREDGALKRHLQGFRVHDSTSPTGGREVPVYFRLPEQEARRRNYPYITIDLLSIARDPEREHRGHYYFDADDPYFPNGREEGDEWVVDLPIPLTFTYQVRHFARNIQHDRQLMYAFITRYLPQRFGTVIATGTGEFGDDNTMRRLDFLGGPVTLDAPDPADPNKRIFTKAYTAAVSSEMFPEQIREYTTVTDIASIFVDLHDINEHTVQG